MTPETDDPPLLDAPFNQPSALCEGQYASSANLDARIALHERFSTNPYGWQRFVFDQLLSLPADAQILEVGCGSGALWRENLQRVPPGWQVTLTDFSPGMVAQAAETLAECVAESPAAHAPGAARFDFKVADAASLPAADGCLDAVIANHMLYHVPDIAAALAEFRRVLKPAGRLFAATNGTGHMRQQWALVSQFLGEGGDTWHTVLTRAFALENGAALLGAHFGHVERHDYEDALLVTDVEALVAYVDSMKLLPADTRARFAQLVAATLETAGGVLRIDKETGLFVAW